jgi:hypothetical protein
MVRDSAGIEIVENGGPAWSEGDGWVVAREPVLSIGAVDGPPAYIFSHVRGAVSLDDGRIAVADGGSSSIRLYGSDGTFLSSTGRAGGGPGEYVDIAMMGRLPGDTLVVVDGIGQRVSFLDPAGVHVRSMALVPAEGSANVLLYNAVGILDNGRILAHAGSGGGMREENAGKLITDTTRFVWFEPTGEYGGRLGAFPGTPRWGLRTGTSVGFPYVPFAGGPVSAVGREQFVIADGTKAELLVLDSSGELERVIRWPASRRASSREMDRLRDELLGPDRTPAQRSSSRQLLSEAPVPDSLPVARAVFVDDLGYVWVERYRASWESLPVW